MVLFSFLSEKTLRMAVEHLLRVEGICFDAIYTRIQTFKKSDEYFNYNQIYIDFEIVPRDADPNI